MQPSKFGLQGRLKYVVGDATIPMSAGHRIIIHVCNDVGKFGKGFAAALGKRWKKPENEYRRWYRSQSMFKLGEVQTINVQSDTMIVNMIAQHDIKPDEDGTPPIRYDALKKCLSQVGELAQDQGSSIHAGRFGAGNAGGNWEEIEKLIIQELVMRGLKVIIYDLPEKG